MYSFGTVPPTIFDSKLLPTPALGGLDIELHRGELAGATRLLLVGVVVRRSPW
jgi:hypothetical protein